MKPGIRWVLIALVASAGVVAGGCESNQKDRVGDKDFEKIARRERNRERNRNRDRRDADSPDQVVARRDRAERANPRSRGMDEIPADAVAVDRGNGADLRYEAPGDGAVYVFDEDDDRVVYIGRLQGRERFVFDPADDRATVDGKTVLRSDLNPRHRYRLYFDRAGR
jgi:hypothetical protein